MASPHLTAGNSFAPAMEQDVIVLPMPHHHSMMYMEDGWHAIRYDFTQLYREEGLELTLVMQLIAERYGFRASVAQYKRKIKEWELCKTLTSAAKQQLGELAEQCIAACCPLPSYDGFGAEIDWDKVRRHYGREKIPLRCLPKPSKERESNIGEGQHTVPNLQARMPLASANSRPAHLLSLSHVSVSARFTEEIMFSIGEWFKWCNSEQYPIGQVTGYPFVLLSQHKAAQVTLALGDIEQATDHLVAGAAALVDAINKPTPILVAYVLGIWLLFQKHEYRAYSCSLSHFLETLCNQILKSTNPLSKLCNLLKVADLSNSKSQQTAQVMAIIPFTAIMKYVLDQIEQYLHEPAVLGQAFLNSLLPLKRLFGTVAREKVITSAQCKQEHDGLFRQVLRVATDNSARHFHFRTSTRLAHYLNEQGYHQEACDVLLRVWVSLRQHDDEYERHAFDVNLVLSLYLMGKIDLAAILFAETMNTELWDEEGYLREKICLMIPALVRLQSLLSILDQPGLAALHQRYPKLGNAMTRSGDRSLGPGMLHEVMGFHYGHQSSPDDSLQVWLPSKLMKTAAQRKMIRQLSEQDTINKPYRVPASYGLDEGVSSGRCCGGGLEDTEG